MTTGKPAPDFNLRASFPEKELRDSFFAAVNRGDLAAAEEVLKTNPEAVRWQKFGGLSSGETAFIQSAGRSETDMMALLLKYGADVNQTDKSGWTALNNVCLSGKADHAEFLIRNGADMEIANASGDTPLINAVKNDHWSCADLLVIAGADVSRKDSNGHSAVDLAEKMGNKDIVKVIRDAETRRDAAAFRRNNPDTRTDTGEDIKPLKPIELKPKWFGRIFRR